MIPKNKRKRIIVDGEEWYYAVSGYTSIFIVNYKTKEEIHYYEDNKPKWKKQILHSDIRRIIKNHKGKQNGVQRRIGRQTFYAG
jgi:hypothetical protein